MVISGEACRKELCYRLGSCCKLKLKMIGNDSREAVMIRKINAAESEEMKCCGGNWSIQKGLSCLHGDADDHDQGEQGMFISSETKDVRSGKRVELAGGGRS